MPRIITIANQKGGVGKTTTAINLATALAAIGQTTVVIDLDPQGNASTGLGIDREDRDKSTYDLLTGNADFKDAIMATAVPRLFICPSTLDLLGVEMEISSQADRDNVLSYRMGTTTLLLHPYRFRQDQRCCR